jgi:uncharacterized protein (TIGR02118 family)
VVHGALPGTVPADPGLRHWSACTPHPGAESPHPPSVTAVVFARLAPGTTPDPAAWFPDPVDAYLVDEQVRWVGAGPDACGLVQCSAVRRRAGLDRDTFAAHWRTVHAPLVAEHHPGVVHYAQNVVRDVLTPGAPEVDGFAELGFATVADHRDRFYASEASRAVVGADVDRFLDRSRGWRMLARVTGGPVSAWER